MRTGEAANETDDAALVADRARLRSGGLRGATLLHWLAAIAPADRDRALERLLGVDVYPLNPKARGPDFVGYVPSGISAIVRAVFDAPITEHDVFVDLGSGLGKASLAVRLLCGARVRGIEIDGELAALAQARADALGLGDAAFVASDAREADLEGGTVFFLYLPFTGAALATVFERLRRLAEKRDITVCTLGLDLPRAGWITPRQTDAFWLSIYDSHCEGAARSGRPAPAPMSAAARTIAFERPG